MLININRQLSPTFHLLRCKNGALFPPALVTLGVHHNTYSPVEVLPPTRYEAPFKTKCHQCFRNLYRTSNIYIRRPIYISDVRYLYQTSGYLYPTSGYLYPTSGYLYPTDIYTGCPIYILDIRYRFRKHWWHFVLNGAS